MSSRRATRSTTSVATEVMSTVQIDDAAIEMEKQEASATPKTQERKRRKPEEQTIATPSKRARSKTPEAQKSPNNTICSSFLDRPAEPHRTNAPLVTPQGSRHIIHPRGSIDATPKDRTPRPTTTTGHILEQACAHLVQVEPKMRPLIEKHYCRIFCPEGLAEECEPFKSLCSGIMAQQVSGAAASSIKRKFIALFHTPDDDRLDEARSFPTPTQVAACNIAFLRQAGLSERKAEYIKGLAEKFVSGELGAAMLINASDEEVLEKLIAVRGLGKWSVEMFACFGLKRMDIFSTGDLGVQVCSLCLYLRKSLLNATERHGCFHRERREETESQRRRKMEVYVGTRDAYSVSTLFSLQVILRPDQ